MTRVKRGTIAHKRREAILKYTKGFRWGRKSKESLAKQALIHAWSHAWRGRKEKKRNFRALWIVKMNAALREEGLSYSKFMGMLKKSGVNLDRKVLAEMAADHGEAWKQVVETAKSSA